LEFTDSAINNIRNNLDGVFAAERRVAEFILKNPEQVVAQSVGEIAEQSGVSDATVIRLCKHLGYTGFYQMKLQLAHELGRNQLLRGQSGAQKPACADDLIKELASSILGISANIDTCRDWNGLRGQDSFGRRRLFAAARKFGCPWAASSRVPSGPHRQPPTSARLCPNR
jgi:AraC-like DNA-binding protein